jgi:hypothetical protein
MMMVNSRLVLAALVASLFCLPGCLQPGSIDDPGAPKADASPGEQPDPGGDQQNPGQPDAEPPPTGSLTFTTDIYPKLQANALGCANCHQGSGAPAGLILNDGAATVYTRVMSGRVDVNTPENSKVLLYPLVGSSATTHPFKPFQSTSDASYQLILSWIQGGAAQ